MVCVRKGIAAIAAATGLALVAACGIHGASSVATMVCEVGPKPARVGRSTITFRLFDVTGRPVPGAHVTLEGDMSHPGMAPVFGTAKEISPGNYRGNLEFTMAGDWAILVHGQLAGGEKFERQVDVPGVRPD